MIYCVCVPLLIFNFNFNIVQAYKNNMAKYVSETSPSGPILPLDLSMYSNNPNTNSSSRNVPRPESAGELMAAMSISMSTAMVKTLGPASKWGKKGGKPRSLMYYDCTKYKYTNSNMFIKM